MTEPGDLSLEPRDEPPRSPWLALTLVTVALVGALGYQVFQIVREGQTLQAVRTSQDPTIEQAQKVRAQVDSIARGTLKLAEQGNANAALIVDELAKRGVKLAPDATPPPATPPKK